MTRTIEPVSVASECRDLVALSTDVCALAQRLNVDLVPMNGDHSYATEHTLAKRIPGCSASGECSGSAWGCEPPLRQQPVKLVRPPPLQVR
jgi:hypothetical protein